MPARRLARLVAKKVRDCLKVRESLCLFMCAILIDIEQSNKVLTSVSTTSNSVTVSYTG